MLSAQQQLRSHNSAPELSSSLITRTTLRCCVGHFSTRAPCDALQHLSHQSDHIKNYQLFPPLHSAERARTHNSRESAEENRLKRRKSCLLFLKFQFTARRKCVTFILELSRDQKRSPSSCLWPRQRVVAAADDGSAKKNSLGLNF